MSSPSKDTWTLSQTNKPMWPGCKAARIGCVHERPQSPPTDVLVTAVLSKVLLLPWAGLAEPLDHRAAVGVKWAPKLSRQLEDRWVVKCYLLCCPDGLGRHHSRRKRLARCTCGDLDAGGANMLAKNLLARLPSRRDHALRAQDESVSSEPGYSWTRTSSGCMPVGRDYHLVHRHPANTR